MDNDNKKCAIFLDVDGVLNNEEHCKLLADELLGKMQYFGLMRDIGELPFDYRSCLLIQSLIKETNAYVVLSSSWRLGQKHISALLEYADIPIRDTTPSLHKKRGDEIKAFLDEHPEISRYIIIDDDSDMLPEQMKNFHLVDRKVGFTKKDYEECLEMLMNDNKIN